MGPFRVFRFIPDPKASAILWLLPSYSFCHPVGPAETQHTSTVTRTCHLTLHSTYNRKEPACLYINDPYRSKKQFTGQREISFHQADLHIIPASGLL